MALKNFVEPHCGEGNPLIKLSHHVSKDKSHRDDLYTWISPNNEIQSDEYGLAASPEHLVEEFMNETKNSIINTPQAFRMDSLMQEMQEIERAPPTLGPAVADLAYEAGTWAREYLDSETFVQEVPPVDRWTKDFLDNQISSPQLDPEALWDEALMSSRQCLSQEDSELARTANELLGTVDDPKFSNTEFMKYMKKLRQGNKEEEDWSNEFLSSNIMADAWTHEFSSQLLSNDLTQNQQWEKEFIKKETKDSSNTNIDSESMTAEEKNEFWKQLQDNWEKVAADGSEIEHPWLSDFEKDATNPFKDYTFQDNNPLKNHPNPLAEGKKYLEMGDIPSAILLFEAAAQQNPSSSEPWIFLGTTHAENEQDPAAISALKRGLDLDPSNLNGWMSLATSYANESYQNYACEALKEWVRNNEEYKHLMQNDDEKRSQHPKLLIASLAPRELLEEVQSLYLSAANLRPADKFDADVQCGLGVLLNLTGEYDKAIDCFRSAIEAKPLDAKLWNKLGATLANSDQSAEAIDAYRHALELAPGFIRCRYNLGVACIHLGAHREAIEHFLEGLNMQERSRGVGNNSSSLAVSDNIWSTLRICLRSLNASHLLTAVQNRDLRRLNEEFASGEMS